MPRLIRQDVRMNIPWLVKENGVMKNDIIAANIANIIVITITITATTVNDEVLNRGA